VAVQVSTGPLDQQFHIQLDDPEAGYRGAEPMKYKLKVQQPPASSVVRGIYKLKVQQPPASSVVRED
jgi:hypothetical protein